MNICDWYLFQGVNNVIGFQRVVRPRVMGLAPDEVAIADAMPKARIVFDELARLLGSKNFFAGEQGDLGRHPGRAAARLPGRDAGVGAIDGGVCRISFPGSIA